MATEQLATWGDRLREAEAHLDEAVATWSRERRAAAFDAVDAALASCFEVAIGAAWFGEGSPSPLPVRLSA